MSETERVRRFLGIRESLATIHLPDDLERQNALRSLLPAYVKHTIGAVEADPDTFAELLRNAKTKVIHPMYYSLLFLAAYGVRMLACRTAEDDAMKSLAKGDVEIASFQMDLAFGTNSVISTILSAEANLKQRGDETTVQAVTEVASTGSVTDQADLYLKLERVSHQDAEILHQDPTGILLVDSHVACLRNKRGMKYIMPYSVPEYFVAGAELGGRLYKSFYRLAERLGL